MKNQPVYGFDKSHRLLSAKDFQQVFNHGHFKVHQDNFMWFVKVNTQLNDGAIVSRLGLAITKKKVKRAHERNRIKRLVREHFRHSHSLLNGHVDMVLTIKHSPESLGNAEFIGQLQNSYRLINNKLKQYYLRQSIDNTNVSPIS